MKRTMTAAAFVTVVVLAGPWMLAQNRKADDADVQLQAAMHTEIVDGNFKTAIEQYKKVAQTGNRAVAAKALLRMAECYQRLGDKESRKIYEQLLRDFSDQKEAVAIARARLDRALPEREGITARQVWTGIIEEPNPSPDGRYVAWVNWDTGGGGVAIHDLVTGEDRDITHEPWKRSPNDGGFAEGPVFTSDGKQVLNLWFNGKADWWETRLIDAAGTRVRTVFSDRSKYAYPLAIAPNGKTAAIELSSNDNSSQLAVLDLVSGKRN